MGDEDGLVKSRRGEEADETLDAIRVTGCTRFVKQGKATVGQEGSGERSSDGDAKGIERAAERASTACPLTLNPSLSLVMMDCSPRILENITLADARTRLQSWSAI